MRKEVTYDGDLGDQNVALLFEIGPFGFIFFGIGIGGHGLSFLERVVDLLVQYF